MQIFVRTVTGRTITINVSSNDDFEKLKKQVEEECLIPSACQKYIFNRRIVTNKVLIPILKEEGKSYEFGSGKRFIQVALVNSPGSFITMRFDEDPSIIGGENQHSQLAKRYFQSFFDYLKNEIHTNLELPTEGILENEYSYRLFCGDQLVAEISRQWNIEKVIEVKDRDSNFRDGSVIHFQSPMDYYFPRKTDVWSLSMSYFEMLKFSDIREFNLECTFHMLMNES